jgi:hypothetical protein
MIFIQQTQPQKQKQKQTKEKPRKGGQKDIHVIIESGRF